MYNLNGTGKRKVGQSYHNVPQKALHSAIRGSPDDSEPQAAKPASKRMTRASGANSAKNDWSSDGEDEISSTKAPSVTTSPRGTRIRRRTPIPETKRDNEMDDHDDFVDIDKFTTPAQTRTRSQALASVCEEGDIIPTAWKTKKERDEETQRLLKEKNSARVNPQYMSGAGFNAESVRKAPKPSWAQVPKRKPKTYKTKSVVQPRTDPQEQAQTTSLDTDDESESKDELQSTVSKQSVTQTKKGFVDPTKRHPLPPAKEEAKPQIRPFRNPVIEHPLPPKAIGNQNGNDSTDTDSLKLQPTGFINPMEKFPSSREYTLPEKGSKLPVGVEKLITKGFMDPFAKKYNLFPEAEEPESQSQAYYMDESDGGITGVKHGSIREGSKKRKASSVYPETEAIDLSTPKQSYREDEELLSSPNGAEASIGGSQSSSIESQFPSSSSQVRHMDDISHELRETKLREQAKKRKKKFETADVCLLCDTVLPLGTLDDWKDDDGELQPIRMAEWTEICNKHKAADLQKEWKEKGYPIIEWKGLKKRVEKYHQFLVDIIKNKVPSPFREAFAKQQKEIRGNTALLLRKEHQLQYPGYYGPRGSGILLHEMTIRLGPLVGDEGKKDELIGRGGVAAFIQTVLVPELAVRLIMEDMDVREAKARIILDESREIGEKLNMDEFTEDIYDEEDGPWFDINAKTPEVLKKKKGLLDSWDADDDDF